MQRTILWEDGCTAPDIDARMTQGFHLVSDVYTCLDELLDLGYIADKGMENSELFTLWTITPAGREILSALTSNKGGAA